MGRNPDVIDGIFGECSTETNDSASTAGGMSPEPPCQIRDLVLGSTDHIPLLAATLRLPLLIRLHVPVSFDMEDGSDVEDPADYPTLFDNFGIAAAGLPSLKKVQVCLEITLDSDPDTLDRWNLWVRPDPLLASGKANITLSKPHSRAFSELSTRIPPAQ